MRERRTGGMLAEWRGIPWWLAIPLPINYYLLTLFPHATDLAVASLRLLGGESLALLVVPAGRMMNLPRAVRHPLGFLLCFLLLCGNYGLRRAAKGQGGQEGK